MHTSTKILLGLLVAGGVFIAGTLLAQTQENPSLIDMSPKMNENTERACIFPVGGWTIVNCSNVAAATSGALNKWSRYVIQCGDDSYLATGDESTDVADANDGYLPSGAWLEFITTRDIRYISCLNVNVDSDCRIWECQ